VRITNFQFKATLNDNVDSNLDAIPRSTIHLSNAIYATTSVQSKETSNAIVNIGMAFILLDIANTFVRMRAVNMQSMEYLGALKDDWIMPNDISRESTQDKMRQCYKEGQDNKMTYEGCERHW
jgi:hypothetical protein